MHITFLLSQELEAASSLGRHFPIAKELVKLGYGIRILAPHPAFDSLETRHFWKDGVEVFYVGQMHIRRSGNHKTYMSSQALLRATLSTTWQMIQLATRLPTDAYQVCKAQPVNGFAGLMAHFLTRKPLFLDSDDYETEFNHFSASWQKWIVRYFEEQLPRHAVAVTTHTEFNVERNLGYGVPPERLLYVPNGMERGRFAHIERQEVQELAHKLGYLPQHKIIVYVGNLSLSNHPIDLLLKAFAETLAKEANARLLLVGGGEDYDTVRDMLDELGIAHATSMVGRITPAQVPLYFTLADVSVEPVYDDLTAEARSPLKVFESLATGTPVVAGDVGERRKILDGAGILVPPGNAHALATGLLTILKDNNLRQQMAQAALNRREVYYWDVLIHDFEQIYHFIRGES